MSKRLIIILCCVVAAILIALTTFLLVKLLGSTTDESAMLYFSSNVLCEEGTRAVAYDNITFDLYNYADELRVSKEEIEDIDIEVVCEGKSITNECTLNTGEKSMQPDVKSSCNVTISLPEQYANKDIEVTATAKPIKKEIKATFSYISNWGATIDDKEGNACALLNLTANSNVTLLVEWDASLVTPETTNPYISTLGTNENKCKVTLKTGEGTQIAFFKSDITKNYSKDSKAIKVTLATENNSK